MYKPRKDHYAFDLAKVAFDLPKVSTGVAKGSGAADMIFHCETVIDMTAHTETLTKRADGEGKFIREGSGKRQYGHVIVVVDPAGRGEGVKVVEETSGAIPKEFIGAAIKGIHEGLHVGVVAGYPVVDVVVRIVGGSSHASLSSESAFLMAGIFAVKEAMKKAGPIVL